MVNHFAVSDVNSQNDVCIDEVLQNALDIVNVLRRVIVTVWVSH